MLEKPDKNNEKQHDLFLVLLHEIGHSLGLDHNFEHPDSIMRPAIDRNWDRKMRSLPAVDVAALRRIYPSNKRFCKVDEQRHHDKSVNNNQLSSKAKNLSVQNHFSILFCLFLLMHI